MSKSQITVVLCVFTITLVIQSVCLFKLRADFYKLEDYAVQNRAAIMYILNGQESLQETNYE